MIVEQNPDSPMTVAPPRWTPMESVTLPQNVLAGAGRLQVREAFL